MSFFDEAKHKIEGVVGRAEQTVGGAFGNAAMEFDGRAHAEHGEALLEEDEEHHMQRADGQPNEDRGPAGIQDPNAPVEGGARSDEQILRERREHDNEMKEVQRKIHEAKQAQNAAADAGEPMRRASETNGNANPDQPGTPRPDGEPQTQAPDQLPT